MTILAHHQCYPITNSLQRIWRLVHSVGNLLEGVYIIPWCGDCIEQLYFRKIPTYTLGFGDWSIFIFLSSIFVGTLSVLSLYYPYEEVIPIHSLYRDAPMGGVGERRPLQYCQICKKVSLKAAILEEIWQQNFL